MHFKMQTFTLNNKLTVNYLLMSSILQALVASSYVPVFSGIFPAVFRGKVCNSNIHLLLMLKLGIDNIIVVPENISSL